MRQDLSSSVAGEGREAHRPNFASGSGPDRWTNGPPNQISGFNLSPSVLLQ